MKRKDPFKYIILLFVFVFVVAFLVACGAREDSMMDESADSDEMLMEVEVADAWDDDMEESFDSESERRFTAEGMEEEGTALGSIPMLSASESGRQLAYTVYFSIETIEFRSGMRLLLDTVADMGGYTERFREDGRSIRQPDLERHTNFVFRIPNEQLSDFILFIEENYNIVFGEGALYDFTFNYDGNEANLEMLREEEQRILDELNRDENDEPDVTTSDLADVREQIRNLEESNTVIQRDVDYSDVTVNLSEVIMDEIDEVEPATFGERLQAAFDDALDSLLVTLQVVVIATVAVLPWGGIVALIVVPIVYIVKRHKKKSGKGKMLDE